MITLTLTPASAQALAGLLDAADALSAPPVAVQNELGEAIRTWIFEQNFANESGAQGPWPELAPSTNLDRILQGYAPAHPILVRSGAYRSYFLDPASPRHISEYANAGGAWTLTEGTISDYRGGALEWGYLFSNPPRYLPPRPVAAASDAQADQLDLIIRSILDQLWEAAA